MKSVIVSAVRTPIGRYGGSLRDVPPARLGEIVLREALLRAGVGGDRVDEVILGNVLSAGHGQNIARQASIGAGVALEVPSYTVNKVCASGLKSVALAAQGIALGEAEVVLAGGVESMSTSPYALKNLRWGKRMGNDEILDLMVWDGLTDVFSGCPMGVTAENVAEKFGITREMQDRFALESQRKAENAVKKGRFKEEIVPVPLDQGKSFEQDEHPRFGTTLEDLLRLKPVFKNPGTVTAGNACGINDGAAALLLMSESAAEELGIEPLAAVKSYASVGVDPAFMGLGPISASRAALDKAGLKLEDMDLVELNEAFAATTIAVIKELGLDPGVVNVNGGAIALGHPIGASGARILVTLLHELKRRKLRYGLAALCIGGGMGAAMVVERW